MHLPPSSPHNYHFFVCFFLGSTVPLFFLSSLEMEDQYLGRRKSLHTLNFPEIQNGFFSVSPLHHSPQQLHLHLLMNLPHISVHTQSYATCVCVRERERGGGE